MSRKGFSPSSGWVSEPTKLPDPLLQKAFKVYNFIVGKGGDIELPNLVKHPSPLQKFTETTALEWLTHFNDQSGSSQEKPSFVVNEDSQGRIIVRVWIRVKLCSSYEQNGYCHHGVGCLQWHVCRGFLEGNCTGELCPRSHNLLDEQNIEKSQKYMLEKHSSEAIRKVLAKNLPLVCEAYIKTHKCKDETCSNLHLCPFRVRGQCEKHDNLRCSRGFTHALNSPKNQEIFRRFAVPSQYLLRHVLMPKEDIQVPSSNGPGEKEVEKQGKRKHKVGNLNNLNMDDGASQSPKLVKQNVPLNIKEPNMKDPNSKKIGKQKKQEQLQKEEKSKLRNPREGRPVGSQRNPQPLMSLELEEGTPSSVDADKQLAHNRQRMKDLSSLGARPKTLQQNMGYARSQNDGESSDDGLKDGDSEPSTNGDAKKRKPRKRGGRKKQAGGTPLSEKSLSMEGLSLQDTSTSSDQNNQPKKGCNRRGGPKQDSQESFGSKSDLVNVEDNEIDLMEFGDEDLQVEEGKLIDLDFDSDQGLSQMSDTMDSKAMWDLFFQDQLCSIDNVSLSQPEEPNPLLETDLPTEDMDQNQHVDQRDQIKNASVKGVFNCIVLEFGGTAKFSEISKHQELWDPSFTGHEKWFRSRSLSFLLVEDCSGNIEEVKAISLRAKLCFKYSINACTQENCQFFHLCNECIAKGRCSNYESCNKNHGFKDAHNKEVVAKLFPDSNFTNKQLKQVIQSSTPQVCLAYNNRRCNKGRKCTRIHVCKNYGHRRCPKKCKLAHENALKTHEAKALLARFRIRVPPNINLYMVAKAQLLVCYDQVKPVPASKPNSSGILPKEKPKPDINVSKDEYQIRETGLDHHICLAFILGQCREGSKCNDHHCPLPYQWIYKTGKHWMMLGGQENTELEKSFCQNVDDQPVFITLKLDLSTTASKLPHQHNTPYIYSVYLKKMEIGLLDDDNIHFPLRRLSTESQVLIPECPLATTWNWYWKDENGLYTEYQPSCESKDPTSSTIEKFYREGMSKYAFTISNHDYQIYFNEMYQKNMDPEFYTKREVIRRPELLSLEKVTQLKRTCQLPKPDTREFPQHWKRMAKSQHFILKKLNKTSKEFKEIQLLFLNSMGDRQPTIESINRVQNPFMWEKYERKKGQMEKMADSNQVHERSVFHGTSYRNIRAICKENFDWRLYGKITGNIYGEGAYFARDASFSHCYCHDDEDDMRYVFVAKVLVGSFTKGEKNYRRPPVKDTSDPHSDYFDSCVDDVDSPQVFVVFDVDQYYPGHVIGYKCPDSSSGASGASTNTAPRKVSNSSNFPPYSPSQPTIGQSGFTVPSSSIPTRPVSLQSSSDLSLYASTQPSINRSLSMPAANVTPTAHGYNPSPYPPPYYQSQSTIDPYGGTPTPSRTTPPANLASQRMSEELERFARASMKSVESKQNCVVM